MTVFKRSRAKYVKGKYRTTNWPEYEAGLRQRGSLVVWISEDELKGWGPSRHRQRKPGGQVQYSDHAIDKDGMPPTFPEQLKFMVYQSPDALVHVYHGCLGRNSPPLERTPVVACLRTKPSEVCVTASMAE